MSTAGRTRTIDDLGPIRGAYVATAAGIAFWVALILLAWLALR